MEGIILCGGEQMRAENKKRLLVVTTSVFAVLFCAAALLVAYILSPLHPGNIPDEVIINKGAEYTVQLSGVSEYDEKGFRVVTDGFYFTTDKVYVREDEKGFACTSYDEKSARYLLGKYNSSRLDYENYAFCGESYKGRQELEEFFKEPDRIYNFDINNLSSYIQDIISYERQFSGRATVKIYRGRLVFTEFYIGEEKVLEYKMK